MQWTEWAWTCNSVMTWSFYLWESSQPPFSSVQSLSRVRLFATPWIAAHQASLSITNSRSSLNSRLSSQWCHPAISSSVVPFFSCPQIPLIIRVFSNESTLRMRWPKYWSFSFSIILSKEIPGTIQSGKTRPGAEHDSDHKLLIANFRLKVKWGKPLGNPGMS